MAQEIWSSYSNLKKLIKNDVVDGVDKLKLSKIEFCESYVNVEMTKLQFGTRKKSRNTLEIIHSDVCDAIDSINVTKYLSHDDDEYFITFIDDF